MRPGVFKAREVDVCTQDTFNLTVVSSDVHSESLVYIYVGDGRRQAEVVFTFVKSLRRVQEQERRWLRLYTPFEDAFY